MTDNDGNYYISGKSTLSICSYKYDSLSTDSVGYYTDAFISKFNKDNVLLWTTFYGSSASDEINTLNINSQSHIYASGSINMHFMEDDLRKISLDKNYNSENLIAVII